MIYGDAICADTVTQGTLYARSLLCLFSAYTLYYFSHVSQLTDDFRCLVAVPS